MPDTHTQWQSISAVARQFNKTRQTIHNWCASGFILTLGYQVRRDPQGIWSLLPPPPASSEYPVTHVSKL